MMYYYSPPLDLLLDIGQTLHQNRSVSDHKTSPVQRNLKNEKGIFTSKAKGSSSAFNEKIASTIALARSNEKKIIINSLTADEMNKKEVKENKQIEINLVRKITGFFWKKK